MNHSSDLFDKLNKLRLLAAVLYDQGTAAGLTEEQKQESIEPLRKQTHALVEKAIEHHLDEVISAIKGYQEQAQLDMNRAKRYREKAEEAHGHAEGIKAALKAHMLHKGQTERIHGNYMATIVDSKLEVR